MISEADHSEQPDGRRFALVGPTYPYRGGIAHHTTLLAKQLRQNHEVLLLSFSRQYPGWLFPGKSDKDPSQRPLQTEAEYLLDPIQPLTWQKTVKRLQAWQPDVVILPWWHPYFALAWTWLSRAIKRFPTAPRLIYICHNVLPHEQNRFSRFYLPFVLKMALGAGDGYILHSQADARILHDLLPQARYHITPLPTYAALGTGENPGPLPVEVPDDRPVLLFCGFVRPYKGLDILIDALARVKQQRSCHLLIAGEFWQGGMATYQTQIDQLQLNEDITILNEYLPDEKLAACIDRAEVVVLPYRSATQSAVIQMAFGRGTPVITTDVGGLAEVVEHGRTGLVVPPDDPAALAGAITCYFEDGLGTAFRQNITEKEHRFSWHQFQSVLMQLISDV